VGLREPEAVIYPLAVNCMISFILSHWFGYRNSLIGGEESTIKRQIKPNNQNFKKQIVHSLVTYYEEPMTSHNNS
jgi:hypothetical protein